MTLGLALAAGHPAFRQEREKWRTSGFVNGQRYERPSVVDPAGGFRWLEGREQFPPKVIPHSFQRVVRLSQ
jgi:hypothetical protein